MSESEFLSRARNYLSFLAEALEDADAAGDIEVESTGPILTLTFPSGKQLVLSIHAPSQQIWLASPLSGGLHFSPAGEGWALPDGRTLAGLLVREIAQLGDITIAL